MKRVLILCCVVFTAVELAAQDMTAKDLAAQQEQQMDAIAAPVQDIDARYWASRVQRGDITLKELEKYSKNWLGSDETNKQLMLQIKKYVESGKPVSVTPQEKELLDATNEKVYAFLKSPLGDIKAQRDAKIDAITAPVQDIDARYWARRVTIAKDVTLGELEKNSKQWLGSKHANQQLLALIKQYVTSGKKIVLTPEELEQLEENTRQVRAFLNNGRENPAAAALARKNRQIRQIEEPVFELEARYWAYRVAKVKDVTFEELERNSYNWVGESSYNQKLINKVEENLRTGNTKKLTKQEEALLEKTNKQVRQLLK